jgi:hypothetical protein
MEKIMPWLPMYMVKEDLLGLSLWLSDEKDIAIIESTGEGKWRVKDSFTINSNGTYCLFHKLAGPLPLLASTSDGQDEEITDPFSGWEEKRTGAVPNKPFFGAGHPAIFWLNVRIKHHDIIGLSSFEWIGNHYSQIGSPAPDVAKNGGNV